VKNLKFNALVRLYEREVFSLALYLLKDRSEAEDMAQEAYIKLWENLAQVEYARAKFWLLRVTRNACLDRLRRRTLENNFTQQAGVAGPANGPMDMLVQERRTTVLQNAVGGLEEPYRSLIILRDIHQNSYQDIARLLELSLDQVKVYLFRARQQLKTRLEAMEL
jgi:RNA polymerase sigma-70 factor (ECF subfamily)